MGVGVPAGLFFPNQARLKCQRPDCPFYHASELLREHPGGTQDLFEIMPCCNAGFDGGCKYHNKLLATTKNWVVPKKDFISDGSPEPARIPPQGVEYEPTYDGQKWSLTTEAERLETAMKDQIKSFLEGRAEIDDSSTGPTGFEYQ